MTSIVSQTAIQVVEREGELVVDSRLVAEDLGIQHKNFSETIKNYKTRVEQRFGVIAFETEKPSEGSLGGRPEKFYWLTESQATFLMTLSRNTDRVVECKANLVQAFFDARQSKSAPAPEIQLPQTYLEALKALVATEEERQRLEAKVEQDAPLVAYAEAVQASETAVEVGDYAKMIGFGRNRLFRLLREMNVIMKNSTLPYQAWINAGYFEVSQEIDGAGKLIPFALITGKGQLWLKQKIDKHQRQGEQFAKMIYQGVLGIDGAV